MLLKLYKVTTVWMSVYGCEDWTLVTQKERRIEKRRWRFWGQLRGYIGLLHDHKTNKEIAEELSIHILSKVIVGYKGKGTLIMKTYDTRIPRLMHRSTTEKIDQYPWRRNKPK
jgi:hypothetical protein